MKLHIKFTCESALNIAWVQTRLAKLLKDNGWKWLYSHAGGAVIGLQREVCFIGSGIFENDRTALQNILLSPGVTSYNIRVEQS